VRLDLPFPVAAQQVEAALRFALKPGDRLVPKRKGWMFRRGRKAVRVRLQAEGKRVRFTMETPGWAYAFIVLGILPFVIAVFVIEASIKDVAEELHERVRQQLLGELPGFMMPAPYAAVAAAPFMTQTQTAAAASPVGVPCPFCRTVVVPLRNAAGQNVCPTCRNTGQPGV